VAAHDIDPTSIDEVLDNEPQFFVNFPDRGASHLMIGPDLSVRFYFAPIVHWTESGGWYPVTAFRVDERRARRIYSREEGKS
jgi:hypothetical protein